MCLVWWKLALHLTQNRIFKDLLGALYTHVSIYLSGLFYVLSHLKACLNDLTGVMAQW